MKLKPNKIVIAIRNGAVAGVVACSAAVAFAGADNPVVRGSSVSTNSTLNKVNVEGIPGKTTNIGLNVRAGANSGNGSYGTTASAHNGELHSGDVSIQAGAVESSILSTNSAVHEVSVKGAAATSGNIVIGK